MTRRQASVAIRLVLYLLFTGGGYLTLAERDRMTGFGFVLLAAAVPILGFIFFSPTKRRRAYRLRHNLCLNCGYDLRVHKPGDKCPECGTSFAGGS